MTDAKQPKGTFDARSVAEFTCTGACGETMRVTRFDAKNGTPYRVTECRSCATTRRAEERRAGR